MAMIVEDKIVFKHISEIRPYIRNPRRNEKTIELLCELIPKVGFNVPIVIDQYGIIVKGHARYGAAIRLGMEKVPCIVSHASEEAIKADRITDNKISEFSEWVNEELEQEIADLDFDLSDLGFSKEELVADLAVPLSGNLDDYGDDKEEGKEASTIQEVAQEKYFKCVCEDCGHIMFVKASDVKRSE